MTNSVISWHQVDTWLVLETWHLLEVLRYMPHTSRCCCRNNNNTVTLVADDERGLLVNAKTQQLIQFVLSEGDEAAAITLQALSQQLDQLHRQTQQLA